MRENEDTNSNSTCEISGSLREEVRNGGIHEVIKSFHQNYRNQFKNIVIECNLVFNTDHGEVYFTHFSYRAFHRYFVTQGYLCCKFNHISCTCSAKNYTSVCSKCASAHELRNCTANL